MRRLQKASSNNLSVILLKVAILSSQRIPTLEVVAKGSEKEGNHEEHKEELFFFLCGLRVLRGSRLLSFLRQPLNRDVNQQEPNPR